MAMKVQGGRMSPIRTSADTQPQFKMAVNAARKSINDAYYQIIKMVESAPNAMKNDPSFDEMDRAFKLFDAALKKAETRATGQAGHWSGR